MRIVIGNKLTSLIFRAICTVELLASFPISASTIKVITFNIRYDSGRDGVNSWQNRKGLILKFLIDQDADIFCLQEVLHHQYTHIKDRMESYSVVGNGRNDGQTKGEYAPIFYKNSKYDLLDNGMFWLSEDPTKVGSMGWDAKQPRIATWAKLIEKEGGKIFIVINTHFDDIGRVARQKSTDLVMEWISRFDVPTILTGDLNDDSRSALYEKLSSNTSGLDAHVFAKDRLGVNYTFHGFGRTSNEHRTKIDYIFVKGVSELKSEEILEENNETGAFLSDHNPIIVVMSF